jgi:hypothetical protein
MGSLVLLLASLLASDANTKSATQLRTKDSILMASLKAIGPWCQGRPRLQLTLKNTSPATLWLDLERAPKDPIEWTDYSYWGEHGEGKVVGGVQDGDLLGFLRSGESARLAPGNSQSWLLALGPQELRTGKATVGIRGPVLGTMNLNEDQTTFYEFEVEISVRLTRSGRCYAVTTQR